MLDWGHPLPVKERHTFIRVQKVIIFFKIINVKCLISTQVLHEEIEIPGSSIKLSYLSSRTAGYKSLLKIIMTQTLVPLNLIKVHLMVAVEGHLFQKSFQASPNLAYTFIWDKTDAYGQKVYGLSDAVGKSACTSSKTFQVAHIILNKKPANFLIGRKCRLNSSCLPDRICLCIMVLLHIKDHIQRV